MPLSTSAEVEASIISWTNAGISSAQAQDLMTLAEDRIYRDIRTRQMEASTALTITNSVATVPSDMAEVKNAYIDTNPDYSLLRKSPEWIRQNYPDSSTAGIPIYFAREGSNFIFGPSPSSSYTLTVNYWKRPVSCVGGTLTGILASSPGLLLYAALSESEPFLGRDERTAVWEQKYQQLKEIVQREDRNERFSGSPLNVTPA
jgi:hypothetical protein